MSKAFNLLDERWIPVRFTDETTAEVGLLDVFAQAHQISAIAETSPPNLMALYRMILAVLHRSLTRELGTWKSRDIAGFYRDGLPVQAIQDYLVYWRERFWLFHPDYPFMQVAVLAIIDDTREKFKPWTQIALDSACGNTPVIFDHSIDTKISPVGAGLALRNLLGFLQCSPGGLVKCIRDSDKAGPIANTAAVLPVGATLAQTLCLALHPVTIGELADLPSWEKPPPLLADLHAPPALATGPTDRYSRLTRAVLLVEEEDSATVSRIRFAAGVALAEDENALDPMASYRAGATNMVRLTFTEGRAVWRDMGALLPDASGKHSVPAAVLGWASNILDLVMQDNEGAVSVMVAGLASDQAKLLRWRTEHVALNSSLLSNPELAGQLRDCLRQSEELFFQTRQIARAMLADMMPDPLHKDSKSRARSMIDTSAAPAAAYFSNVERSLPELISLLTSGQGDEASTQWVTVLCDSAERVWSAVCRQMGNSPMALRAQAKAESRFRSLLKKLQNQNDPTAEKGQA